MMSLGNQSSNDSTADSALAQVWTVGHSTRSESEFVQLLLAHEIKTLVDVRSFPSSRRFPQFNQKRLIEDLSKLGITYHHSPALGGRRQPNPNSRNTAWKNASFRAYADYMETPAFAEGVNDLLETARQYQTAIMCAEALWWKCHRSLISDYLKASGVEVNHILATDKVEIHPYTSAARVVGGKLSYRGLLDSLSGLK
jgi:uncharacterized protein (DUF488 family)